MSARVWCLGDAVVDLLPQGDACLMQCPGGAPANVAVGIARLQGNSGFIGRVGDDLLKSVNNSYLFALPFFILSKTPF